MEDRDFRVGYVSFILGYEFLNDALHNSMMHSDEAYTYCAKLAEEFLQSEYDDEFEPVHECIENFVNDKMPIIEEYIKDFNISIGA